MDAAFVASFDTSALNAIEHRIVTRGGLVKFVEERWRIVHDEHGKPARARGTCQDITQRHQALEALRASEERLRVGLDAMKTSVFTQDLDLRYTWMHEPALGYDVDQVVGRTDAELLPAEAAERVTELKRRALTSGRAMRAEVPVRTGDQTLIFDLLVEPFRDASGQIVGLTGASTDITERVSLAAQLQQAQKMEAVGRLAGGVAHDYNNMLSVILGHAEMGLLRVNASPAQRDHFTEIYRAATRSAEITQQLLTFARRQVVKPQLLDLNATVANALKMLEPLIGEQVQFTWTPGATLWPVTMDATQMDVILTNLCLNARDAMRGAGQLVIATANRVVDAAQSETLEDAVPGDYVQLTVTDSGRGMSREMLEHIFEPFYTTKGFGEGTGLGLASVYGAVRQAGGFVAVSSVLGEGSTFEIYLPREAGAVATGGAPDAVASGGPGHETILVAEDQPAVRSMTALALEAQGYTVLAADGPDEAIRLAQKHGGAIALVLTDVQMPGMSGYDLAATLGAAHPRLKHLFMSGYPQASREGEGQMEDAAHFLAKPFTLAALTAKVREVLDGG